MPLTSNSSDAEICAQVAERVAGWTHITRHQFVSQDAVYFTGESPEHHRQEIPHFLQDANAVIELLEKWVSSDKAFRRLEIGYHVEGWCVELRGGLPHAFGSVQSTFHRAAVFALLRAHGVTIEEPKP